jgi:signal transduction histidine kinase
VEISRLVGGKRRVFSQLGPGEIFGEMAVIEHRPRSATATALKEAEVYFIPRGEMLSLIQRSPALAFAIVAADQPPPPRIQPASSPRSRRRPKASPSSAISRAIVHDLKNPLSIIGLSAEMFDMPSVKPEIRAKAQARIKKQVERINDMVGDILIFTEAQARKLNIKAADYPRVHPRTHRRPPRRGRTQGRANRMENVPPAVLVPFDPRRLRRVFFNLVHNATDVMLNGGTIFLRFQRRRKRNHHRNRGHRPRHRAGNRRTNFSSLRHASANPTAPASAFPSAKKSSRITAAASGCAANRNAARFFASRCRWQMIR